MSRFGSSSGFSLCATLVVGFPMVLKPPAGMGAKATFRVTSLEELLKACRGMNVSKESPVLAGTLENNLLRDGGPDGSDDVPAPC